MSCGRALRLRIQILLASFSLVTAAAGAPLVGDLDGDGAVGAADEALMATLYGSAAGDGSFDPAADLTGDGRIDVLDLGRFGAGFGASGGDPDTAPPSLFVSVNDIPDDMNDLLVVPPDGFQITLSFGGTGSLVDLASLSVTSSQDMGIHPAGAELAGLFTATPTGALWEVPAGMDLARTSHHLDVRIADIAGNEAIDDGFGFAVRDFVNGPPLAALQIVFLDFDRDRNGGNDVDFLEDLRTYGLSSNATSEAQALEPTMRDLLVSEIAMRVHGYYGRNPDGSPGPDAANVQFVTAQPSSGPYTLLCVGGESSQGAPYLGSVQVDTNNQNPADAQCGASSLFGVFPQAIDNLWGGEADYHAVFDPLDPGAGGTPVGEDPLDAVVLAPGFNPFTASPAQLARLGQILVAVNAFAQIVAGAAAHETGHYLGLVAQGPAPGGLFGGTSGATADHNVQAGGPGTPAENLVMNQGGSFTFAEMSGYGGVALPVFRPLNWAYLHDRVAPNWQVTGLYDPPVLHSLTPNPVTLPQDFSNAIVTLCGEGFYADSDPGVPEPFPKLVLSDGVYVFELALYVTTPDDCDPSDPELETRAQAALNLFNVAAGSFDVLYQNPDGQSAPLAGLLEIQ